MAIQTSPTIHTLNKVARPWGTMTDMDALLDSIGDAQYVLLGEASHGTHDYYLWRSRISQRLITEKNFSFIAVEGDWPDCYQVNRYVKRYPDAGESARNVLRTFQRWPSWMWANEEIAQLIEWLRRYNANRRVENRVGFYGLDVYSLWDSMAAVIEYLEEADPGAAEEARQAYRCFEPYVDDPSNYAYRAALTPESCEDEVVEVLRLLREKIPTYNMDYESGFNAEQNARVAVSAEHYYRTMVRGDAASWNVRDTHMADTLNQLMKWYGPDSKAIVWAHNTHIGDARYTDMRSAGLINIGQLTRESHGNENVRLIGFGSYTGSVIAGKYWDSPMEIMYVPPAQEGSWESYLHAAEPVDKLILSTEMGKTDESHNIKGHRAIGVVYNPEHDHSNYVPTLLPERYDAFIYLDTTKALRPLQLPTRPEGEYPETFPWGV